MTEVTASPSEITRQTTAISVTSSSSRDAGFYFQCAVFVIAAIGAAANALILYALVASKQHKKHVLIFNQNALDFVSCLFLGITYIAKLCNISVNGTPGYWLCMTLLNDAYSWSPFLGSLFNLAAVTVERYLKVVHAVWANKHLHNWIIYSAVAFAWIGGIVVALAVTIHTTGVVDGVCYTLVLWKSQTAQKAFGIWYFLTFYVIILLIFIFCYAHILYVIRRQARLIAAHSGAGLTTQTQSDQIQTNVIKTHSEAGSTIQTQSDHIQTNVIKTHSGAGSTTQTQSDHIQTNVIKTMMLVCLIFAVTMAPASVYFLLLNIHSELPLGGSGFYTTVVLGYLYNCANPFIYATKFHPVKRVLLRLSPCKTTQPLDSVQMT